MIPRRTALCHGRQSCAALSRPGARCCRARRVLGRGGRAKAALRADRLTATMFEKMEKNSSAGTEEEHGWRYCRSSKSGKDTTAGRGGRAGTAGGAGGRTSYEALKKADAAWKQLRELKTGAAAGPAPKFVQTVSSELGEPVQYDVAVCGGTLGIFLACALQLDGLRVAVVERGALAGRAQEWNISRKELQELVEARLLTEQELRDAISIEFNPVRCGFHGGSDVWTHDVLNLGVSPSRLIQAVSQRFQDAGGTIMDRTVLDGVTVLADCVSLEIEQEGGRRQVAAGLLVDCMGHLSPIVRQLRWGVKPDGVCLVVGSCSRGFQHNRTGDVIFTNSDEQPPEAAVTDAQFFWEAFPSGSGPADRTTYLFTYIDADPRRPGLESMMEEYWRLMPQYQGVALEQIEPLRILFGFFPTFRSSPLPPGFDRILQVGDASGIQSPLSFGGFGALCRHLPRLRAAVGEAVRMDALQREQLQLINPYNPGLSATWMLQRAMSFRPGQTAPPAFVNNLLASNFQVMEAAGTPVLKPFLQDVMQFGPLAQTLLGQMLAKPLFVPAILNHVGAAAILGWAAHFIAMGAYTLAFQLLSPLRDTLAPSLPEAARFRFNRLLEALEYGSGLDYYL